jgi:hypothetical protein
LVCLPGWRYAGGLRYRRVKGGLFDDSHTLSKLIGRPTTPLAESVKAIL